MSLCRILPVALLLLALTAGKALAENLVVFGDDGYAPVIYVHEGKAAGVLPAIFARLAKDTGDTYELVLMPWKRALEESMAGRGGITNISLTQERARLYDFSEPIYHDDIQLVVLQGREFLFTELKDLKNKLVGGGAGASYGNEVDQAIAAGVFSVQRDPGQISRMRKLLAGRVDVAIVGNGSAGLEHILKSDPQLAAKRTLFVALPKPLVRDPLYLAFAKSMEKKAAIERFNKALLALKKTAEYRQLISGRK